MLTFALDTSTDAISVALLEDEELIGETYLHRGFHHAVQVLPSIQRLFAMTGKAPGDAGLFTCTIGPGSFTGLRVGLSTIKGLALTTGKPVVGISTLDALAANITDDERDICPLLDAGNGKVYTARYRRSRQSAIPDKITGESLAALTDVLRGTINKTVFLGPGAKKYASVIAVKLPATGDIAANHHHSVRAAVVGYLGRKRFINGDCTDIRTLTPDYLQPSAAEM